METTAEAPLTAMHSLARTFPDMAPDLAGIVAENADHVDALMTTVDATEKETLRVFRSPQHPLAVQALTELGQKAETALGPVRARLEALGAEATRLEGQILDLARSGKPEEGDREIRDVLRSMKQEERDLLYLERIRSGDAAFARAIENNPAGLPLVSADAQKMGRQLWAEAKAPEKVARLSQLRTAQTAIRRNIERAEMLVNRKTFKVQR